MNGNSVTAYGLFIEHYQQEQVVWNGDYGTDIFFQNEMPYDPPSQAAWMENATTDGYPAFVVSPSVRHFSGYGLGSYSFFELGIPIEASEAFQVPSRRAGCFRARPADRVPDRVRRHRVGRGRDRGRGQLGQRRTKRRGVVPLEAQTGHFAWPGSGGGFAVAARPTNHL